MMEMVKPSQEAVWELPQSLELHETIRVTWYGVTYMHTSLAVHCERRKTKIARAGACE